MVGCLPSCSLSGTRRVSPQVGIFWGRCDGISACQARPARAKTYNKYNKHEHTYHTFNSSIIHAHWHMHLKKYIQYIQHTCAYLQYVQCMHICIEKIHARYIRYMHTCIQRTPCAKCMHPVIFCMHLQNMSMYIQNIFMYLYVLYVSRMYSPPIKI